MPDPEESRIRSGLPPRGRPAHPALSHGGGPFLGGVEPPRLGGLSESGQGTRPKPSQAPPPRVFSTPAGGLPCAGGFSSGREEGSRRSGTTHCGRGARSSAPGLAATVAASLITAYRWLVSPLLPPSCRFHPTCSTYALSAYRTFGFWKGTRLTIWRLLRCQPFHPGGYDPLPGGAKPPL